MLPLQRLAALMLLAPLGARPAVAQATDPHLKAARERIERFDQDRDGLSRQEQAAFVSSQLFKLLDDDRSGALSLEEYAAGLLDLDPSGGWPTETQVYVTRGSRVEQAYRAQGSYGQKDLERSCSAYRAFLEDRTRGTWHGLCTEVGLDPSNADTRLAAADLARALRQQAQGRTVRLQPAPRLAAYHDFTNTLAPGTADATTWEAFLFTEHLVELDTDSSGGVDLLELQAKHSGPLDLLDWIPMLVEAPDGRNLPTGLQADPAMDLVLNSTRLARPHREAALTLWSQEDLDPDLPVPRALLRWQVKQDWKAAKGKLPSSYGYLEDVGWVYGPILYDAKAKQRKLAQPSTAWIARLVKSYDKAGEDADPATLSWTRSGGSTTPTMEAAVRLEYRNADWDQADSSLLPVLAWELDRTGSGAERAHRTSLYVGLEHWRDLEGGLLDSQEVSVGVALERDHLAHIEKLTGLITLKPQLNLGSLQTGTWYDLTPDQSWRAYLQPRAALEINDVRDRPAGEEVEDGSFLRLDLALTLELYEQTKLSVAYEYRAPLSSSDSEHTYTEASLYWPLDELERVNLSLSYKEGEDTPSFSDEESLTFGLGVKF